MAQQPKQAPPKHGGLMIAIGVGKPKPGGPPDLRGPDEPDDDETQPEQEPDGDEGSGEAVPPDAVSYRTASEQCHLCNYMMHDGTCSRLKIPVAPGDGCNLFRGREDESDGANGGGNAPPQHGAYGDQVA